MMKLLEQKSYAGEVVRPLVELTVMEKEGLVIAASSWGSQSALTGALDSLRDFFSSTTGDLEATSPFGISPDLSPSENRLRSAIHLTNDRVFTAYNKGTYTSAFEGLILQQAGHEVAWAQIGQPHLFLLRSGKIIPLAVTHDLALSYTCKFPLPQKLFGSEKSLDFEIKSLKWSTNDALLLLARSFVPPGLLSLSARPENIQNMFDAVVADDPTIPFWIATLS